MSRAEGGIKVTRVTVPPLPRGEVMKCENPLTIDPPVILTLPSGLTQTGFLLDVRLQCSSGCLMIDGMMEVLGSRLPFSCSLRMDASRPVSMTVTAHAPSS
jgi:hypothetical protein